MKPRTALRMSSGRTNAAYKWKATVVSVVESVENTKQTPSETSGKSPRLGWDQRDRSNILEGIMDADLYIDTLQQNLLPFIRTVYPTTHRFMQDNDLKHTSRKVQQFFVENSINWWKTPAESPDCNPIENLWHELKDKTPKPRQNKN